MTRPLLLDLFCGAGGAAVGYHRAGFDVIGVDINPQPNYPYKFIQGDALNPFNFAGIKAIHASPPCQRYSTLAARHGGSLNHPDLVDATRDLLESTGLPWVIENVPGAPLHDPVTLCGTMFDGVRVIRHRLFETNWPVSAPPHPPGKHPLVFTYDKRKAHYGKLDPDTAFIPVYGGNATVANKADAMGIDWMTGKELNQAIPPAYTEWIGQQLMETIR